MYQTRLSPDEILQRIRAEIHNLKQVKPNPAYRLPLLGDFRAHQPVLCFDQTLTNCGWALLEGTGTEILVRESGTIRPPTVAKSFEATFTKSVILARDVRDVIAAMDSGGGAFDQVVLELPSVMGYRTESSLVAAVTICIELDRRGYPLPAFVSRMSAAAKLCGDRMATKKYSSTLVDGLVDRHPSGTGAWTEHVRDAVFVGLKYLYMEEK